MIRSKHHIILTPGFNWLIRRMLRNNFHSLNIMGEFHDNGKAVLVLSNHISWWDGFWIAHLNQKKIHRKIHFMMLADQLKKHWYFQHIGGYPVQPRSRQMLESLRYTVQLLENRKNVVLVFPQGQIHSQLDQPIHFKKGIEYIIKNCNADTQILFVANFFEYFSDKKPNVDIYMEASLAGQYENSEIEKVYNEFYLNSLHHHKIKTS